MLVIDVGVKFRTVSVKCANIFDQDCSLSSVYKIYMDQTRVIKRQPEVPLMPVYTCIFCCDFWCDFLLLVDVKE